MSYAGDFYRLEGAYCAPAPGDDAPRFYLGGASPRALGLSARQSDVHLGWIEPVQDTAQRIADLREQSDATGRPVKLGLRTHLVIRDDEEEAWASARSLIADAAPEVKAQRQSAIAGTPMVGQQAQAREAEDHRLARHLWNGLSEVRVNCGSALVGTPEQVADELLDYWRLGIDEFILSGFPHVEECERAAADLLPLVRERVASETR